MTCRILTIDGSSIAYPHFIAGGSDMPGSLVGKVDSLARRYMPAHVFVAWDTAAGSAVRKKVFNGYKDRSPKPAGYYALVGEARELLASMGVHNVESQQGEADDVIATICRTMIGPHVFCSADKDMLQLITDPGRTMVKLRKRAEGDLELTVHNLKTTPIKLDGHPVTGLGWKGWRDILCLAGDKADGIPGVKGLGAKMSNQLLVAVPGVVDLVLQNRNEDDFAAQQQLAANWPAGVRWLAKLFKGRDELRTMLDLVKLRTVQLDGLQDPPEAE